MSSRSKIIYQNEPPLGISFYLISNLGNIINSDRARRILSVDVSKHHIHIYKKHLALKRSIGYIKVFIDFLKSDLFEIHEREWKEKGEREREKEPEI